jgi:hypothetical protein
MLQEHLSLRIMRILQPALLVALTAACGADGPLAESIDVGIDTAADTHMDASSDLVPGDVSTDVPDGEPTDPLARGNSAPTLGSVGDRRVPIGTSTVIALTARDADNDPIEFFANGVPEGARFQKSTGVFVWVPTDEDLAKTAFVLFGVRDESGAEDTRLITLEVVANAETNPPSLDLPDEPISWPSGQTHVWAVPASDPDGDAFEVTLAPGAPPEMGIDGGFLTWNAPTTAEGQTLPIGIVVTDATDQTTTGDLRISVVDTSRDSLPAVSTAPGSQLVVDLIPDRGDAPADGFICGATVDSATPSGSYLDGCTLVWDVPSDASATSVTIVFAIDLISSEESPDLYRDLEITVASAPSCSPVTEFTEEARALVPDEEFGLASFDGTFCSPRQRAALFFDVQIPLDAGRLQSLLIHDNADVSDLDLVVDCTESGGSSVGLVGEEFVDIEVIGGEICYVDVTAYSPVPVGTEFELTVLTTAVDAGPECADDTINFDLFFVDSPIRVVSMICDDAELDLEFWAVNGATERLVDYVATDGPEETIAIDPSRLMEGESGLVRVVPWEIGPEGAEFIIEATGGD